MDDPDVISFDAIVNAVWIPCDKMAPQFGYLPAAYAQMGSCADEFDRIQER
jgi:hypothetical protein